MGDKDQKCLFCGKPKSATTKRFIGGGGAIICEDCIKASNDIELDEEAMVRILTEPRNSLVKQYRKLLELDGVELEFEPEALREIAQTAMRKNTGARGLRAIMENVMEDIMFDMPDEKNVRKCIITKAAVRGEKQPVIVRDTTFRTA